MTKAQEALTPEEKRVVEYLRSEAVKGDVHLEKALQKADPQHQKPEMWAGGVVALNLAADAIQCREHMKGQDDG